MKLAGTFAAILLIGAAMSRTSFAASFGAVTLEAGASKTLSVGVASRTLRVCNDANSSAAVVVTIGSNAPHYLSSGLCAEDIGEQVTIRSLGGGPATVDYKATCDGSSMN